jgi:hypothetical protein
MKKQASYDDLAQTLSLTRYVSLPAHERVLDRLADLLFAADDTLETLHAEDARSFAWVEVQVQTVYDTVNEVMKRLCD